MKINIRKYRDLIIGRSTRTVTKILFLPIKYMGYILWLEYVTIEYVFVWKQLFGFRYKGWMVNNVSIL